MDNLQLGLIGLGTMGVNLARNAARSGSQVAVYNRSTEKTDAFMKEYVGEGSFTACKTLEEMAEALPSPRVIMLMVKAGDPVDAVIADLLPLLDSGDILIDAGNSHYDDTERRTAETAEKGVQFVGMGVSGGEEGALHGPSMMPGGDASTYELLEPLLQKMSADDGDGGHCVAHIGPGGAGHFVKMVHNGIEYAIMQAIAESYDLLKTIGGYSNAELAETFASWNESEELESFLVEITAKIFAQADNESKGDLIDVVRDTAKQKGTGKWTTEAAMTFGVAVPTINAAVDARILSGSTDKRASGKAFPLVIDENEPMPPHEKLRAFVRTGLELSMICAYEQGFELMRVASEERGWNLDLSEIARIWRGGCIIRSAHLAKVQQGYAGSRGAGEAILDRFSGDRQLDWRRLLELSYSRAVPTPALSASLNYYDTLRRGRLPANLVAAQRDFFGAHGYERIDKKGSFHTEWESS